MANFVLEDTSGHCEGVCFKYDDFADALEQDAIVKVRGKFEHSDRGDQIMAFEVERLAFDASQMGPSQLEIRSLGERDERIAFPAAATDFA